MSLLSPDIHAAILELLTTLKSNDNVLRAKAEEVLNAEWVQKKPDILLMALAEQILASEDVEVSLISSQEADEIGGLECGFLLWNQSDNWTR
jgi:hypothetical protein